MTKGGKFYYALIESALMARRPDFEGNPHLGTLMGAQRAEPAEAFIDFSHCEEAKRPSGGGGVPLPPTVGSFCILGREIVRFSAHLRQKFNVI